MAMTTADKRAHFRNLHREGCFVLPNPWDIGSARYLAGLGFKALATTSAGFAWSMGRPDESMPVGDVLAHLRAMAAAVDLPVNADFENGYADRPEDVALHVGQAVQTGVAGLSIEDSHRHGGDRLYDIALATARVRAARLAINASGEDVVLTARAEGFLVGRPDLADVIARLTAYADAGADCLFAPGLKSEADIAAVVRAVAPAPVNVVVSAPEFTVARLAELGVRRISLGGGLARAAWTGYMAAARDIAKTGSFGSLRGVVTGATLNAELAPWK